MFLQQEFETLVLDSSVDLKSHSEQDAYMAGANMAMMRLKNRMKTASVNELLEWAFNEDNFDSFEINVPETRETVKQPACRSNEDCNEPCNEDNNDDEDWV